MRLNLKIFDVRINKRVKKIIKILYNIVIQYYISSLKKYDSNYSLLRRIVQFVQVF
jgi:hypothetical protein